ncbi:hypothetical protein SE17_17915, partial [Kouleothrix aurantiaca]
AARKDAEALADTVGIIDGGRKVAEGTPAALVAALGADRIRISGSGDTSHLEAQLRALPFVETVAPHEHGLELGVDHGGRRLADVVAHASGNGFQIEDVAIVRPSLGDVFLKHTGRALRD